MTEMTSPLLYLLDLFIFPLIIFSSWLCYILWYNLNTNAVLQVGFSWQGKPLTAFEITNHSPNWKEMWEQSNTSNTTSGW